MGTSVSDEHAASYCRAVGLVVCQDSHQHKDFRVYPFLLWRWKQLVPVKSWYLTIKLYGITSQKSVLVIVTTVHTTKCKQSWYLSGSIDLNSDKI